MKKRFFDIILLISVLCSVLNAQPPAADQASQYSFNYRKIVPGMPENAALGAYGNLPVNTAKGTPNISFNLYTVSRGGVDVPVSIAYNASGVKFNDIASCVGMKWSLDAGGSINRSVNGIVDEDFLLTHMSSIDPDFINYENFHINSHGAQDSCKYIAKSFTDCSLDYYFYSFPGHSGSMYLGNDLSFRADKEYRQLKIDYAGNLDSFSIRDGAGNTYIFGSYSDYSTTYNTGKYNKQSNSSYSARVSWKLNRIITVTKQQIIFEYTPYYYEYLTLDGERWTHYIDAYGMPVAVCPMGGGDYYSSDNDDSYQTTRFVNTGYLVSKISTEDQDVLFNYTTNTGASVFQKQLTDIKVYSKISSDTVKRFSLLYSGDYLQSFEEKGKAGASVGKKTSFVYNGDASAVMGIYSKNRDILGYYNATSNSTLMANDAALFNYYPLSKANRRPTMPYAAVGTLSNIFYPTGGHTVLEYEYNMDVNGTDTLYAPGIRVRSIMDMDGNDRIYNKRKYYYSKLIDGNSFATLNLNTESPTYLEPAITGVYYSENQNPYSKDNFYYQRVMIENIGDTLGSVHLFEKDYYDIQYNLYDNASPLLLRKDVFLEDTNHLQQTTLYDYQVTPLDNLITKTYLLRKAFSFIGNYTYENDPGVYAYCPPVAIYDGYDLSHDLKPMLYDLVTQTTKQYSSAGDSMITVVNHNYNSKGLIQQTETIGSDSTKTVVAYTYPFDYPADAMLTRMKDSIVYTPVVTEQYLLFSNVKKEKLNNYAFNSNGFFTVSNQVITDKATGKTQTLNYYGYNAKGQPLSVGRTGDITNSYIWDYLDEMPVAEVAGADTSGIAYTSFEADGKGRWSFSGTPASDTTAVTGKKDYALSGGSITRSGLSSSTYYTLSYWSKSSSLSITGTQSGWPKTLATITRKGQSWTLYEHRITGQTTITVSGSVTIDELRLYPETARMTSYTYEPMIGISSQSDMNGKVAYYTYDAMGRLILIRDQYNNILKKVCYNYAGQPEDCPQSMYWSKARTLPIQRNNCSSGYIGSFVVYGVPWGKYTSDESQAAADQLALDEIIANAQTYANTNGSCTFVYYNVLKSATYQRNNCGTGYVGTSVNYSVLAGTYSSFVSQAQADSLAQADVDTKGQAYANSVCNCNPVCFHCSGIANKCVSPGNCEAGVKVYTSSVWDWDTYVCTYHYEWSDGSWSEDYTENAPFGCL